MSLFLEPFLIREVQSRSASALENGGHAVTHTAATLILLYYVALHAESSVCREEVA